MPVKEIDFELIENKSESKVFTLTNDDGSVYDMTGSSASCKFYNTGDPDNPTTIACTINTSTGKITVPFTNIHTADLGIFEYIIEETKVDTTVVPVVMGNITIVEYTPFSNTIEAFLRSELPDGLTLNSDYQNQRITYWRLILQDAFEITDEFLNIESAWPTLVNALIAKLIAYDALILAAKGSLINFLGGNVTESDQFGGPVKKVETGPANVEYYSASDILSDLFQKNAQGYSAIDELKADLCGLANKLKVKLPMCKGNIIPIKPQYHQNPDWDYPILTDPSDS